MKNIGIGAIGVGDMGLAVIRGVLKVDERVKLHAVYDPSSSSVEKAKEINPDSVVYDDFETLVNDPKVDWVMIASWNNVHKEQAIAAFQAGKHVFCQKPLAMTLEDCLSMRQAWKQSGKMFNIGFTLRYSPHYRRIKELLASGVIGNIVSMEFNETLPFNHGGFILGDWRRLRENAGTHILEKCCHDIDLANWFVDSRASRVASFGGLDFFKPENEKHMDRIGPDKDGNKAYQSFAGRVALNPFTSDKDIVDNQVAIIEYENKVRATFHTNCNAGIPERRMYILGSEGALRADVLVGKIEVQRIGWDTALEDKSTEASGGHGDGDDVLAGELVESMINGVEPVVGVVEGLEASITCFAIDDAMDSGTVVHLEPYWAQVDQA